MGPVLFVVLETISPMEFVLHVQKPGARTVRSIDVKVRFAKGLRPILRENAVISAILRFTIRISVGTVMGTVRLVTSLSKILALPARQVTH